MTDVITHGQANWDKVLNRYLEKFDGATADSKWIKLPLKNTVPIDKIVNYLEIRTIGPFFAIKAQFGVENSGETTVGNIPDNVLNGGTWRFMNGYNGTGTAITFLINNDRELIVNVDDSAVNAAIELDAVIPIENVDKYL